MEELEKIVQRIEEEKLSLQESLELFEEGIKLCRECGEELDRMEQKVVNLTEEDMEADDE